MNTDSFAEELFDQGLEFGAGFWKGQAAECKVGSLESPQQRTDKVTVWRVYLLLVDLLLPEFVRCQSLGDAVCGQCGIPPGCSAVAVQFSPIALAKISQLDAYFEYIDSDLR